MSTSATMHAEQREISVLHSVDTWLWRTMTWLYTQVRYLPNSVQSFVLADRTDNLDQFPLENLTSLDLDSPLWRVLTKHSWRVAKYRQSQLLQREIDSHRPHVLHSHFGQRGWANIPFAERSGLRQVVSFYGYDASRLPAEDERWRQRYAELFVSADLFLCEGPFLAQTLVELGCPPEKAVVHHLGVPVDEIRFESRAWRRGEPLRVLIAGTFVEKKGIPYAIQALGRIKDEVDIELTIVGDSNGQERSEAEKQAIMRALDDNQLNGVTRLLGYQSHARLMQEAYRNHVFLSPSVTASDGDSEGGAPVTLIEMAASGIPIVSSVHCDIPNVVIDEEGGLLADERDTAAIAERLVWLLEHPDRWGDLTSSARQRIETHFDCRRLAANLAGHYRATLGH